MQMPPLCRLNLPRLNNGMNMNFAPAGDMGNTVLLWHDPHAVALGLECRAELSASRIEIGEDFRLVGEAAQNRLVVRVAAHETEVATCDGTAFDSYFNQHTNPPAMPAAEMACAEREIAKTVEERSALVDFDW